MSAIFLSHSSRDDAVSDEVREWLEKRGHTSIFLDFDPAQGIPPGRDWERELYQQLRDCRAVIVLCSEHSMASRWCFVEIAHAKSFGKHIFPVKVGECSIDEILTSRQVVDLTAEKQEAFERLWRGLLAAGLDPAGLFDWSRERPPYPGLLAFQKADAAIFFGRDAEIRQGLDALHRLRRFGGARALTVFGTSGSGKSSLVRAGLLPRLERGTEWLVVEPFRPLGQPVGELAAALASTLASFGQERDWRRLRDTLGREGGLEDLSRDLRLAAGRPEATVLLVLDQAEELLATDEEGRRRSESFLRLLRGALEAKASSLMALLTVRSDLYGALRELPALRGFESEDLRLGPMSSSAIGEVVEGPARLAGLELEPGLVREMVSDAETGDALPLLAFTLRELYERCREETERRDGQVVRLTVREYREGLGGLEGSVARAAESVYTARPLSEEHQRKLRRLFLSLVRIGESGDYTRRPSGWTSVPGEIHEVVERFVEGRLLAARGEGGERSLEVAHEALFRSWSRLRAWLDENRELLLWQKRLEEARREWERLERDPSVLLRGPALAESRAWLERRGEELSEDEREYVGESLAAARRRRRRQILRLAAAFALLAFVAVAGIALWRRAEQLRVEAEDLHRVAIADDWIEEDPTRAALVLLSLENPEENRQVAITLSETLQQVLADVELRGHDGHVFFAAFSPDGLHVVTASEDGTARLWYPGGALVTLFDGHEEALTAVARSADGRLLVTASEDGTARLWQVDGTPQAVFESDGRRSLTAVALTPDGERVVTGSEDGEVRFWNVDGTLVAAVREHRLPVTALVTSPDGQRAVSTSDDHTARIWNVDAGSLEAVLEGHGQPVVDAAFSPDGTLVATASKDRTARIWGLGGSLRKTLVGHEDEVTSLAFSPDGTLVATASEDGTARIWSVEDDGEPIVLEGHEDAVRKIAFDRRGQKLVTASEDVTARVWNVDGEGEVAVLRGHLHSVVGAAFSPDGQRVVTASWDGTARIWETNDPVLAVLLDEEENHVVAATFSPDRTSAVTAAEDQAVRLWKLDGSGPAVVLGRHDDTVTAVAFSPEGTHVVSVSEDTTARLWNVADPSAEPAVFTGHRGSITAVAFRPDGAWFVTGSEDTTARLWAIDGGEPVVLSGHAGGVTAVAFSPDGQRVVTASEDATARTWRLDGSEVAVLRGHTAVILDARFFPDGERVATCSADRTAAIWSSAGTVLRRLRETGVDCRSTCFSPAGDCVATVRGRGHVWVRRFLPELDEPLEIDTESDVLALSFNDAGDGVLTIADDGVVREWLLSASLMQAEIERSTRICLAPEFRRRAFRESEEEAERKYEECKEGAAAR